MYSLPSEVTLLFHFWIRPGSGPVASRPLRPTRCFVRFGASRVRVTAVLMARSRSTPPLVTPLAAQSLRLRMTSLLRHRARHGGGDALLSLGCSLDRHATAHLCDLLNGSLVRNVWQELTRGGDNTECASHCSYSRGDAMYVFHTGAGSPPYYMPLLLNGHAINTSDAIRLTRRLTDARLSRQPTFVVVDASLWDVSSWYSRRPSPWPPHDRIRYWCTAEVPTLLATVSGLFPSSRVAFRTPPRTAFSSAAAGHGQDNATLEAMAACLWEHTDPRSWQLHGRFDVLPYHELVDAMAQQPNATTRHVWPDKRHPGVPSVELYLAAVLLWMKEGVGAVRAALS